MAAPGNAIVGAAVSQCLARYYGARVNGKADAMSDAVKDMRFLAESMTGAGDFMRERLSTVNELAAKLKGAFHTRAFASFVEHEALKQVFDDGN